jgi:hypothetical protein
MPPIRECSAQGWRVRLDLSRQVLELEVPESEQGFRRGKDEAIPLQPTLPAATAGFISAGALLQKAKQFDDGLYAAAELAAQQGAGRFAGKWTLLPAVAAATADTAAATLLYAACALGELASTPPAHLRPAIESLRREFLADERRSKPLGFYTWSDALRALFRQDRMLQKELDRPQAEALAAVLKANAPLQGVYRDYVDLTYRLTNPPVRPDLGALVGGNPPPAQPDEKWSFFPPSRSHETDLGRRLFGKQAIPEGFDLMAEMIRRIRAGALSLRPTERSGWYEHQTWSLEPLLIPHRLPEAKRLRLGERYQQHLEELFKGAYALARETHVKQLEAPDLAMAAAPRPAVWIRPELTVEPLAACYLRRAESYRFVRGVLEHTFGSDALIRLHRLTPEGQSSTLLSEELAGMEALFRGAYLSVCRQLGMASEAGASRDDDERVFSRWAASAASDPDLVRDVRMMVPVFYDALRGKTKVWAFLGWAATPVNVSFAVPPAVVTCESDSPQSSASGGWRGWLRRTFGRASEAPTRAEAMPEVRFGMARQELATPVLVEVYVGRLLDRDEFRAHCDRHRSRRAIVENLD